MKRDVTEVTSLFLFHVKHSCDIILTMKKKYRLRKSFKRKLKIVFGLIMAYIIIRSPLFLRINGEKKIYIEAGDEYTDLGCRNILGREVKIKSEVDTTKPGKYHVTYSWLGEKTRRTVYVTDTKGPQFNIKNTEVFILEGTVYDDTGIKAYDIVDGDVTSKIVVEGNVDNKTAGDYRVIYSVEDSSKNKTELIRTVHVISKNEDYSTGIKDNAGINKTLITAIRNFYNTYFTSIRFLNRQDFSSIISNSFNLYKWEKSLDLLIDVRKNSTNDLSLYECSYSLSIDKYEEKSRSIDIYVLESTDYLFNYNLEDAAQTANILTIFSFNYDGELIDVYKEEGFNSLFEDCENREEVNSVYKINYENSVSKQRRNREILNRINEGTIEYVSSKTAQTPYNRQKAVEYANRYALKRNPEYIVCNSNCVNFVSQCMHAGDIRMIYTGTYQWKCYGEEYNRNNEKKGHTNSWTYIPSYMVTLDESDELIAETGLNVWYAEEGDCLMMYGSEGFQAHVVLCSKVVRDENGDIIELLFCGNTNDMKNYPLSASVVWDVECEKIIGCN